MSSAKHCLIQAAVFILGSKLKVKHFRQSDHNKLLNMSAFEDEFEIPAASEVDPAAEFLAKEQVNKCLCPNF